VAAATGFTGEIHWDTSKPDGTPKKQLDVGRLSALGWRSRIQLSDGLYTTTLDYCQSFKTDQLRL
jgi:GDP-L-fucose synthase